MDYWTLALLALYVALAVVLARSGGILEFPCFSVMIGWTILSGIPYSFSDWSNPNVRIAGQIGIVGSGALRVLATIEAFVDATEHLRSKARRVISITGLVSAAFLSAMWLLIDSQYDPLTGATLAGWAAAAIKSRAIMNALFGLWLLFCVGFLAKEGVELSNPFGNRSRLHAVLLSLLCISTAFAELRPAGKDEGDYFQAMLVIRTICHGILLLIWMRLFSRRRPNAVTAS